MVNGIKNMIKLTQRQADILKMREAGLGCGVIAKKLKISPATVSLHYKHAKIRVAYNTAGLSGDPFFGLSTRIKFVLSNYNCTTRDDALKAVISGRLNARDTRNLGYKSFDELCQWLDLPIPVKGTKGCRICPNCGHHVHV